MSTEIQTLSQPRRALGSLPRAAWIGGGLLGLLTAGFAGAMIMRTVEPAPSAPIIAAPQTSQAIRPAPGAAPAKPAPIAKANAAPGSTNPGRSSAPVATTPAVVCATCGSVESVSVEQQQGQATGLGAVAGGVLGGVVGHQVGGGKGKTAMTVLGAVGGGLAGNEVEKRARSETVFNVRVRMDDGSTRTFQQSQSLAVGTQVVVEGSKLRVTNDAASNAAPQMQRATAPAGART